MTKKDYELIAKTIYGFDWENHSISQVVIGLSHAFKKENPKFNSDKFLTACGLDKYLNS